MNYYGHYGYRNNGLGESRLGNWAIYYWHLQQQQAAASAAAAKKKQEEEAQRKKEEDARVAAEAAARAATAAAEARRRQEAEIRRKIEAEASIKDKPKAVAVALKKQESSRASRRAAEEKAKRDKQAARLKALKLKHQRQAAYGRDIKQIRPKHAGYATESERVIGGSTGYYKKLHGLGDVTDEVNRVSAEIERLSDLVKIVAKDVKRGTVPKSELTKLILSLEEKTEFMKKLSRKSLDGFGAAGSQWGLLKVLAVAGVLIFLLKKRV